MCGIIGTINYSENFNEDCLQWVKSKIKYLKHRGPDDEKIWISRFKNIIFGHTKLSIIDLSENNTQPMVDEYYGITLTYNGEIYNYLELRSELNQDYEFKTNSDTEVIIKSYLKWGEKFLEKIEGMFALALFDQKENFIFLARDRLGEKPLFYYPKENSFVFSSELNAFHDNSNLNKKNLNETLLNGFPINKNETILEDIKQVEPGEIISLDLNKKTISKKKYWKLNFNSKTTFSSKENEFDKILNTSVEKCLVSDVKTCITLSGGLDSSIITAVASKQKKIDTYSVVFKNKEFDERSHISRIVNEFKTNHHEIEIDEYSIEDVIEIIEKFDLPILDSSIIPSYLLFKNLNLSGYKVAVGGDGGDEVFGGYNHYKILNKIEDFKKKYFNFSLSFLKFLSNRFENLNFKGSQYLSFLLNTNRVYKIPFFFKNSLRKQILKSNFFLDVGILNSENINLDTIRQSQYLDISHTLPLSLLNKLDRCSMLNSIESRSPFLTKEIIEFSANNLKSNNLVFKNIQKKFLKEIGKKYLPQNFIYNRKQGFSFPLINIIKDSKQMKIIEQLLTSKNSVFEKSNIHKILKMIVKSKIRPEILFCLLSIQIWIDKNKINI